MLAPPVFAFHEFCEFKLILSLAYQSTSYRTAASIVLIASLSGCWRDLKERSYDAPKIESEFVKGREPQPRRSLPPMMGGSSIPLEDKRILGAVIPDGSNVYFVKATDRIARLALAESEFRSVVERFAVDPASGSPKFELPAGWSLKLLDNSGAGIGLAEMIAEINVEVADGRIRFTVSKYDMPREQTMWDEYLLGQINRWRGQVELPPTNVGDMKRDLPTIPRVGGNLPAYLFVAQSVGASTTTITKEASTTKVDTKAKEEPQVTPTKQPEAASIPPVRSQLKLIYDKPEGWEIQAPMPYREATFKVTKDGKEAEVTVSTARDSPVQNAAMWVGQVLTSNDRSKLELLAKKTVDEAEPFQAGTRAAKLYTIRESEQPDARSLLVVSIPMGDNGMSVFVKLNCELRLMEQLKSTFLSFVNTLRWE